MSQLIALIIAIALGAIVTAIGYVFLGDAFTKNSERGVALQFINQGSQVEMAMTAYRAENASSAGFNGSTALATFALLQSNDGSGSAVVTSGLATNDGLVVQGYLKDGVVAPQGSWTLEAGAGTHLYMVSSDAKISSNVCAALNKIQNNDESITEASTVALAVTALETTKGKFRCYKDAAVATLHTVVYNVE
jgi:hypothetical protein